MRRLVCISLDITWRPLTMSGSGGSGAIHLRNRNTTWLSCMQNSCRPTVSSSWYIFVHTFWTHPTVPERFLISSSTILIRNLLSTISRCERPSSLSVRLAKVVIRNVYLEWITAPPLWKLYAKSDSALFFLSFQRWADDANRNAHRLLHPGADTKMILQQYVSIIKCLRTIDPQGVLLFKVADPIRRYLRSALYDVRISLYPWRKSI